MKEIGLSMTVLQALQRCGDYILMERLNEGATAVIYLARDKQNKPAVVRKLHHQFRFNISKRREFARGLTIQSRIRHPAIPMILTPPQMGWQPYAAMEFVDGVNLRHAFTITETYLSSPVAIFKQILAGLHFIHQSGFLHLDLKPENIMISRVGEVKIMDFDLAEPIRKKPVSQPRLRGTLNYIAPEQFMRQPVDERTDIYSLGVIAYELFSGQKPYLATTRDETARVLSNFEIPHPSVRTANPTVPPGIAQIIARCLEKHPVKRYPDLTMIIKDLHATHGVS